MRLGEELALAHGRVRELSSTAGQAAGERLGAPVREAALQGIASRFVQRAALHTRGRTLVSVSVKRRGGPSRGWPAQAHGAAVVELGLAERRARDAIRWF